MSTGLNFGEFQFLIQQGASNFTARALSEGKSQILILGLIKRLAPDTSEGTLRAIMDVGTRQYSAGRKLESALFDIVGTNRFTITPELPFGVEAAISKPIPLREIPIVEGILGTDTEGNRVRIDVEIGFEPDGPARFFQFIMPSVPTWRELYDAARDRLLELAGMYPEKFPYTSGQLESFVIVSIVNAVRAF